MTVRVEVPELTGVKLTLVGFMEAVRPEGETAVVSVMLPVNPPRLLRVMLEVADWVARILRLDEPVDMAKSTTLTANVTERVIEPPVAVTVTV